ncbi:immunoglobulin-like domain-containing receptor 2 isoform X1 [Anarrhichthys ocellatus]|uniref:immunoglobulin-like domain-containing receptor 2 isoform X1 n=1 Tax=Anarrhichthys ocellatus TaxID=433405 RepID=UPI0012ED50AF|nr:immunoglobulin-like domain-containing receptor 2 isoform X1 [Anarrhichthys ocellatus]
MNFYRLAFLLCASVCVCDGVHVTVREKQRFAMLFQSVVLPCQYQTASTQNPVVQWWYKSYCRDRTRESFTLPESLGVQASELGAASHLECSDSSRTVRVVASAQGASMTLAEHYKGRDIAIVNKADLRIGELQWGDSGVYFCKVVIADDLEGKNEAQLELLVLGRTGQQDDILPEFDVEIMPEWVFVGSVVLGSILFLLLLGICWCQCCPHSCCCYVSCCCCPDTCCCPRHLYEAGKMAKSGLPAQVPVYPYYIPGVPTVVPLAPSSHVETKIASIPSVENNLAGARIGYRLKASPDQDSMKVLYYIEKDLAHFPSAKSAAYKPSSLSELSSLHDGGTTDFRHTYQTVQMKALPPIPDLDDHSVMRAAPPAQSRRPRRDRGNHSDDELDRRRNPHSEHLQRKTLGRRGRTGSLDELEDFAQSYDSHGRRAEPPDRVYQRDYSPPRRFYRDEDDGWVRRSPSPLPQKRRDTWDSDRPGRPPQGKGYDDAFLSSVLDSKTRGRGRDRGACRPDEDSDTPSKGSSRGKDSYYSRSPSNRPEEEDPLPPYSEREAERYRRADPTTDRYRTAEPPRSELYRTTDPTMRPFCYTRPHQGMSHTLQQGGREEQDRSRNLSTALSRDSLIV